MEGPWNAEDVPWFDAAWDHALDLPVRARMKTRGFERLEVCVTCSPRARAAKFMIDLLESV